MDVLNKYPEATSLFMRTQQNFFSVIPIDPLTIVHPNIQYIEIEQMSDQVAMVLTFTIPKTSLPIRRLIIEYPEVVLESHVVLHQASFRCFSVILKNDTAKMIRQLKYDKINEIITEVPYERVKQFHLKQILE